MGNAIKRVANCTLNFFGKVKGLICDASKKIAEVVVNGVKKIVNYFKKILEYSWNGIKIVAKLLYYGGKELIHTLTSKLGIPYLIQYFIELINKKVIVKDENNNIIDPQIYFKLAAQKMNAGDQIKIKSEIIHINNEKDEMKSIQDFEDHDELEDINGLQKKDSIAIIDEKEVKLDNISRANTNFTIDTNYLNYSNYPKKSYGNYYYF